ncbi:MAG: hypothetical protein K9J17_14080 [Flavobacteriales bacterium]|nr:hypothetical protein [Flavobacteriales bacterium]
MDHKHNAMQGTISINGIPYVQVPMNATWTKYVDALEKALPEHPEDELKILRALMTYTGLVPAKYDRCLEVVERVLQLSDDKDDRAEALLNRATILFEERRNLEEAEALFIEVHSISNEYQQTYENLVRMYMERKDLEKALHWAESMACIEGMDHIGLELKGDVLLEMGRIHEALEAYEASAQLDCYPSSAYFGIAKCHLDGEHYEQACQACIKAYETCHRPEPLYAYGAGFCYQHLDDPYRAMKWYTKCLDIEPSYANALNNMAVLSLELSNGWEEAVPYLLRAVELSGEALNKSMRVVYRNLWAYYTQILDKEKADYYQRLNYKCLGFDDDRIDFLNNFGEE